MVDVPNLIHPLHPFAAGQWLHIEVISSMLASLLEGPVKWPKGLSQIDKKGFGKRAVIKYATMFVSKYSSWLVGA